MNIKNEIKIIETGWTIKDVATELGKRYNNNYSPECAICQYYLKSIL